MKLNRPIIFFDIESTGVNPQTDRIIELSAIKVFPDESEETKTWLLNPGIPIPPETAEIHGITDDIVCDCPKFEDVADEIFDFFRDCDLAGYNSLRFDAPILKEEFSRAGKYFIPENRHHIDVMKIFHKMEPRDLSAALSFYCGRKHTGAHGAEADTRATLDIFRAQLKHYNSLPQSIEELDEFITPIDPLNFDKEGKLRWINGELCINFGQHKGKSIAYLAKNEANVLKWIEKKNFPSEVRNVCSDALANKPLPQPPKEAIKK